MSTVRMTFKVGIDNTIRLDICDKCGSVFESNVTNKGNCLVCKVIKEAGKL